MIRTKNHKLIIQREMVEYSLLTILLTAVYVHSSAVFLLARRISYSSSDIQTLRGSLDNDRMSHSVPFGYNPSLSLAANELTMRGVSSFRNGYT